MKCIEIQVSYRYDKVNEMIDHISDMNKRGFQVYCGMRYETGWCWIKYTKDLREETK